MDSHIVGRQHERVHQLLYRALGCPRKVSGGSDAVDKIGLRLAHEDGLALDQPGSSR